MTRKLVSTSIENQEYQFVLIKGLREENAKLKKAINEVLDLINEHGVPDIESVKNRLLKALK